MGWIAIASARRLFRATPPPARLGEIRLRPFSNGAAAKGISAIGHSSWFRIEEEGMKNYELLCRGTAFFFHSSRPTPGSASPRVMLAGSGHVAAPYRYPQYFAHDWLQAVRDEHCVNQLDVFDPESGRSLVSHTLNIGAAYVHPTLDLALLDVPDYDKLEASLHAAGMYIRPLELRRLAELEHDGVRIEGHELKGAAGSEEERVFPAHRKGRISLVTGSRVHVKTDAVSVMGMCGGPARSSAHPDRCIGALEGVVMMRPGVSEKEAQQARALVDDAVIIPAEAIDQFASELGLKHANVKQ